MTSFAPSRRKLLQLGAVLTLLPLRLSAADEPLKALLNAHFQGRKIRQGHVSLTAPALAENGNSVALDVHVDSPMTQEDYVKTLTILAPENPVKEVARFTFSPLAGRAEASIRIRYATSQTVIAVAEMSDGTLWSGGATTMVTMAACVEHLL